MNQTYRRRNSLRLSDYDYKKEGAYFVTISCYNKLPLFKDFLPKSVVEKNIKSLENRFSVIVNGYAIMPDHLHLLAIGANDNSNLKKFITLFKQKSGYWYKKNYCTNLWHISYYDHVLRKEENKENVALYILGNPVRKGLVSDFKEYPFGWSFWTDQS